MNRPALLERTTYQPNLPVEEFIVPLLKSKIESVLHTLPVSVGGYKVLDLGCGGQPFRPFFEKCGHEYVSADAQDSQGIVDYVFELDQDVPAPLLQRGPFDFILCTEVMEHVADWDTAFRNCARLLKPKGRILITCPHFYILHEQPYDFWRPTIYALKFYARRYDFDEVAVEMLGDAWDVLGTVLGASADGVKAAGPGTFLQRLSVPLWNLLFKMVFRALRTGWLQTRFSLANDRYPVYLCNVALLEKR
jgi:SAM-dependent methyltransferase